MYLLISKASAGVYDFERLAQSCYGYITVFSLLMVVLLPFEQPSFLTNVYVSLPLGAWLFEDDLLPRLSIYSTMLPRSSSKGLIHHPSPTVLEPPYMLLPISCPSSVSRYRGVDRMVSFLE